MYGISPLYLVLALPAIVLVLFAQRKVQSAYRRYSEIPNQTGLVGAEVARLLLKREQLPTVKLEITSGALGDRYDPEHDVLRLSLPVAQNASLASLAITAHEVGHALQERDGYRWLRAGSGLAPLLTLSTILGCLLFAGGFITGHSEVMLLGIIAFSGGAFFSLVTLPVELDAGRRAIQLLDAYNLLRSRREREQVQEMLDATAFTYVAGAVQAFTLLLSYLVRALSMDRSRRVY